MSAGSGSAPPKVSEGSGRLVPVPEPNNRAQFPVVLGGGLMSFGRSTNNHVVLNDPEVSKFHAEIRFENGCFILNDLGSSNGTSVNGIAVDSHELEPGDVIEFGSCRFSFELPHERRMSQVTIAAQKPSEQTRVIASAQVAGMVSADTIREFAVLRNMYKRVCAAFEAVQSLIDITDIRKLCERILEVTFELVRAEAGAVLLFDDRRELIPWATRTDNPRAEHIVISRAVVDQVIKEKSAVLASDVLSDNRWHESDSMVLSGFRSLLCVPLLNAERIYGILHVGNASEAGAFATQDLDLIGGIGTGAGVALNNAFLAYRLAQEARTRQALGRFLSPALVEQVVQKRIDLSRGGDAAEVTVMFADIRGFTSLTERSRAEDVVSLLNEYFDEMVEVVFHHDGILDKFIGDAIMAVWGTPISHDDDAKKAIAAAQEMQGRLERLNSKRSANGQEEIEIGIGLASGKCVAGTVGARRRMEFTVIGDAVNLASRLCDKAAANEIICDEETYRRARKPSRAHALNPVQVKGKDKPVSVYRI